VGERYATWTVCTPTDCNAIVHDTQTGTTRRVPAPVGKGHYAPVVDEAEGQLYFARSGPSCGATVKIMRVPAATPAATPVALKTLPSGIDVGYQFSIEDAGDRVDLWFSRFRCDPGQGDLYRLRDVGLA
jgi:hypothetical protein